ncbi:MAG: TraB/GumN family protein [Gammaproteobacteria bacterium]
MCIPGNHDEPAALYRELRGKPFVTEGHVDMGAWRIVLLDSCLPGSARGHLTKETLAALDSALSSADNLHTLVCLHHHPVAMSSRWLDQVGLDNAAEFFDVIDRHRNVRAIVWGHVHQAYDALRKGVRLIATPSTCAQFLPRSDDFAVDSRPPRLPYTGPSPGWLARNGGGVGRFKRGFCRGWLFLTVGLLGGVSAHADAPVWAIKGSHNTVYLAGSVHLLPAAEAKLPEAFAKAYSDSSALVMEIDLDDLDPMQAQAWMLGERHLH